ncbi:MAG: hypothetical protein DDT25_00111 [Chloroflexi bacterium]|nr:hypothetical protein [Chloroflexota bacterium]
MLVDPFAGSVGTVGVRTTTGRGMTPEEIADIALDKIMSVSKGAPPVILEQAMAFREDIRKVLVHYLHQAAESERVSLVAKFHKAGYPELVKILDM